MRGVEEVLNIQCVYFVAPNVKYLIATSRTNYDNNSVTTIQTVYITLYLKDMYSRFDAN